MKMFWKFSLSSNLPAPLSQVCIFILKIDQMCYIHILGQTLSVSRIILKKMCACTGLSLVHPYEIWTLFKWLYFSVSTGGYCCKLFDRESRHFVEGVKSPSSHPIRKFLNRKIQKRIANQFKNMWPQMQQFKGWDKLKI